MAIWWLVLANGKVIGRCYATADELRERLGAGLHFDRDSATVIHRPK